MLNNLIWPVVTLGGLAILFGIILAFASKKFAVEVNPKAVAVREILPGGNCGACGFAGCDAFSDAVSSGKVPVTGCPVGGSVVAEKIAEIMGVTADTTERKVARVLCAGDCNNAKEKYEYQGIEDCRAAAALAGGSLSCKYGCTGLGSCEKVCPFDAIHVVNGVAVVDEEKCTACGKCIEVCPKNIIELVPVSNEVRVLCKNQDKGKDVVQVCKVGCIGCQKCVTACKFDAIVFENNLARIDYSKCTNCMMCAEVCPTHTIYANFNNRKKASIDEDKCIGCTICAKNCEFDAIEGVLKGTHKVLEDKCVGCGVCVEKCPKDAIVLK